MTRNASTEMDLADDSGKGWQDRAGAGGGLGGSAVLPDGRGSVRSCHFDAWRRVTFPGAARFNPDTAAQTADYAEYAERGRLGATRCFTELASAALGISTFASAYSAVPKASPKKALPFLLLYGQHQHLARLRTQPK
jgi:hypothetical protein